MEIFLDTANLDEIKSAFELGLISGVTTNPSLMAKAGYKDYKAVTREICYLVQDRISAEVVNVTSAEAMVAEAREIATWSPHVVVKIPVTVEGLKAISLIAEEEVDVDRLCQDCPWSGQCCTDIATARELVGTWGIRVNATLVFSANQALYAANAGASFVSPFVGRLDDVGEDGMALVENIVSIFETYGIDTQVIAASLRHPLHITQSALAGADIATVPYEILMKSLRHPLTDIGMERFVADWAKVSGQK
ncbi:MAG TPA: transaldolase family protein [Anaerolineae bacterium]|nr:transaldolase family protein [Anaerolineae bacterium]HNT04873.1 transaldolase family protein [Anaerolineae bacterium]